LRVVRQRLPRAPGGAEPAGSRTSEHLARLFAYDEVERLAAGKQRKAALELAAAHKLVTSVSGAVVLENAQQYKEAGLAQPGLDNVPSVPEPAFWALLACAVLMLSIAVKFSRRVRSSEEVACG
jgi:hypothetical protein